MLNALNKNLMKFNETKIVAISTKIFNVYLPKIKTWMLDVTEKRVQGTVARVPGKRKRQSDGY